VLVDRFKESVPRDFPSFSTISSLEIVYSVTIHSCSVHSPLVACSYVDVPNSY
jgi:hypothetical protein